MFSVNLTLSWNSSLLACHSRVTILFLWSPFFLPSVALLCIILFFFGGGGGSITHSSNHIVCRSHWMIVKILWELWEDCWAYLYISVCCWSLWSSLESMWLACLLQVQGYTFNIFLASPILPFVLAIVLSLLRSYASSPYIDTSSASTMTVFIAISLIVSHFNRRLSGWVLSSGISTFFCRLWVSFVWALQPSIALLFCLDRQFLHSSFYCADTVCCGFFFHTNVQRFSKAAICRNSVCFRDPSIWYWRSDTNQWCW